MSNRRAHIQQIAIWVLVVIAAAGMVVFLVLSWRDVVVGLVKPGGWQQPDKKETQAPVELIKDSAGHYGLAIGKAAWDNLEVNPVEVLCATHSWAMPPQIGTVNYDNDF